MDAEQDLAKEKKYACGGCLALSKTSVVCLAVLALAGLAAACTVVVVSIEKDNDYITSLMSSTYKVYGERESSHMKNAQPQSEDFNFQNFDKPTAVSDEFVAKGYDMLEPGLGNSAEKSKDKAESYEVEVEKMRIENKKLRDKAKILEFKLEKLRNENDKLKEKSENVEVEVKKLRIENEKFKNENEKLRDKAKKSELKVEKLRIGNVKLNDEAKNNRVELEKLRIENEKLRGKVQNSEIRTENLSRENEELIGIIKIYEVKVETLRMENDKIKDETKNFEVELEKLKMVNKKLIDKARNSEVEVEKLKMGNIKLFEKARNSKDQVEKLKIECEKLKATAQHAEVEVEKLKTENEKLKAKAQHYEVEAEKLKTENEKLKTKAQHSEVEMEKLKDKAQNSEVKVDKLIDETLKVKDDTEKSRVESQILEDEIGAYVNDPADPVYDTENSGDDAENSGDDADNSNDDADNSSDDADNSNDDADNSSDDADNSGDDADNSSDDADNSGDDADNSGDDADNSSDDADNSSDDADNSSDDADVSKEAHTDAPEVSVSIRSSGLSITLYCHVTASPPATEIYWSTPDRERIDSTLRRQYTESTQRSSLYYTRVNFAQVGGYSCTATNAVGTSTSNTVNITVHTTYKVYTDRRTYLEASKACNDHGGTLAMPTTAVEYQNMENLVKLTPGRAHDLWIGITRKGNEWRYEEGPILGSWKNWARGDPDNSGGNENCVSMRHRYTIDGWRDVECSFEAQFVCQFNNIDPVHPPTSFDNPAVPFTAEIPMGMRPGRVIYVKGIPNSDAIRFQMTLFSGPSYTPSDLPLYFDVRFKYGYQNTVVLNSMKQGFWGKHTVLTTFPFMPVVPFEIKILCEQSSFKIYVNNEYFADFPHRAEPESANYIKVVDGVRLIQVRFQDEM